MMDERRISELEFDGAMQQVTKEMVEDPKLEGIAKLMIPLTGSMFADKMKKILFPKENKEAAK